MPDTLFIGPTRSGTTWIDTYLRARGDVDLPVNMKETFFFDRRFEKGLAWYESCFPPERRGLVCVELAPSLFHKAEATARVAACLPGVRAVCTLRDPVDRAVSHYFHYRGAGEAALSFAAMVEKQPDILEAGMYHKHLERWVGALGSEAVFVLRHEELLRDPARFCQRLCALLSLPNGRPLSDLDSGAVNGATVPRFAPLARLMFRTVAQLRRSGADRLVNALKSDRVKRLVYGAGVDPAESLRIRAEAARFRPLFRDDVTRLEDLLRCDFGAWK